MVSTFPFENALDFRFSAASGLVAALVGTPADVIKTRIMNQPVDSNGR